MKLNAQSEFNISTGPISNQLILIGQIENPVEPALLPAGIFAAHVLAMGQSLCTYSFVPSDIAQHVVTTRTPQKFQKSKLLLQQKLRKETNDVVIFLDDLFSGPLQSDNKYRRFKETIRRAHFLNFIRANTKRVFLIRNTKKHLVLLRLANTFALKHQEGTLATMIECPDINSVLDQMNLSTTESLSKETQQQKRLRVRRHAFGLVNCNRMSPRMMLEHLDLLEDEESELRDLAILAKSKALRTHPLIMRLRPKDRFFSNTFETPPPFPLLSLAQQKDKDASQFGFTISRYANHLRQALKLESIFDLKTPENVLYFTHWYEDSAFERTPSLWVPTEDRNNDPQQGSTNPSLSQEPSNPSANMIANFLTSQDSKTLTPDLRAYLQQNPAPNGPTRMAILLALLVKLEGPFPVTEQDTWKATHITHWFDTKACNIYPFLCEFSAIANVSRKIPEPSISVIGYTESQTGLGANMKMSAAMLTHLGVPVSLIDTDHKSPVIHRKGLNPEPIKKNMVLHHVNADRIPMNLMSPDHARRNDQLHIGYLLWELEKLPHAHHLALDMLDEVWAPSHFVANVYRDQGKAPVHLVKKGLFQLGTLAELPAMPKDDSVFTAMVCFDFHSSVERKNPLAAVQGFLTAFPRRHFPDCRMVVKTTPSSDNHWGDPNDQMGKIRTLASEDDRIVINETLMPAADFWRFLQSADCLLSTHRAEGFGYLPAYAMALGIPVVATDYGGTTDFCTASTASPIAYALKEVPKAHSIYEAKGARWADVRRDDVAVALRAIYTSSDAANARARFGRSFIRREYSIEAYAARCRARLKVLGVL